MINVRNIMEIVLILFLPTLPLLGHDNLNDVIKSLEEKVVTEETRLCVFGRLPDGENYRWIHAQLVGPPVKKLLNIFNVQGAPVQHVDGPFAAECAIIVRASDKKGKHLFNLRLWNSRVAIEVPGDPVVSFESTNLDIPQKAREVINEFKVKKEPSAFIFESSELNQLLEQLAINDPQI